MEGARPNIGEVGQLEVVEEDKVEVLVQGDDEGVRTVVKVLKQIHPYEEVAYDVYPLADF